MNERIQKKGIGIGGKPLKEMLAERDRLWHETGCYQGIKELYLEKKDALKLELLQTRLLGAVVAGRETTRMITASPLVREVGELAVALYTPEGDCILQSTGIVLHMPLIGQVIEWMIRQDYEEKEGINEGDAFTCNDNSIAGMHPPDIYDIMPIHFEGKLIGWVGTVIMEIDCGSMAAPPLPASSTDRFTDGFRISAEKTVINDTLLPAFERKLRFGSRIPDPLIFSRKGALAANIKVREEIHKIINEFGLDYYGAATRELIERERRTQIMTVKSRTVPGRLQTIVCIEAWMSRTYAPINHAVDQIHLSPLDFHIEATGEYFLDFDGTGPWGWHPHNTSPSAISGAACLMLTQTIACTGRANSGTFSCVKINAPHDTYVNPASPYIATGNLFSWPINGGALSMGLQSRAFFCRGFFEEMEAPPPGTSSMEFFGKDHFGREPFGFPFADTGGTPPSGAFGIRDGIVGHAMYMPNSDIGNDEIWEVFFPVVITGRKLLTDAAGWGKYRSGYPIVTTVMINKTDIISFDLVNSSTSSKIYVDSGMFGGYPGHGIFFNVVNATNTQELIAKQEPLAHGHGYPSKGDLEENIKGRLFQENAYASVKTRCKHGDWAQLCAGAHAGGIGDPTKRSTELVKKDLDNGLLTIESARRIYCVEAKYDEEQEEWVIDEKQTLEMRIRKRKERLSKGIPMKDWWKNRRKDLLAGNLPEILQRAYNGSLLKGERWPSGFRAFWDLPSDYSFKEEI